MTNHVAFLLYVNAGYQPLAFSEPIRLYTATFPNNHHGHTRPGYDGLGEH